MTRSVDLDPKWASLLLRSDPGSSRLVPPSSYMTRLSGEAGATQLAPHVVSGIGFDAALLAKIVKRRAPASAFVEIVIARP